jgi:hypothetical protein
MTRSHSTDPLDALRALTTKMRGLLDDAHTRYPEAVPSVSAPRPALDAPAEAAPRTGGDAYQPHEPEAPRAPEATPSFVDEEGEENALPLEFATATMGHVLLGQAKPDEARAIFLAVLSRTPDDEDALRGMGLLGPAAPAAPSAPDPVVMLDRAAPPAGYDALTVRALAVDPRTLTVWWEVPADRAPDAPLTLCVVSLRPGLHGDVERVERRLAGVPRAGERFVQSVPAGAEHHVAVGVVRSGEFSPLAHAPVVRTPRGSASDRVAQTQATVAHAPVRAAARAAAHVAPAALREGASEVFEASQRAWGDGPSSSS